MTNPKAVARAAPTSSPIHGDSPHRVPSSAAEYAPSPKNAAWPSDTWPA